MGEPPLESVKPPRQLARRLRMVRRELVEKFLGLGPERATLVEERPRKGAISPTSLPTS